MGQVLGVQLQWELQVVPQAGGHGGSPRKGALIWC